MWAYSRTFPETFQNISGNFPEQIREHSGNVRKRSGKIPEQLVKIPLVNPLLKSVSCVPPHMVGMIYAHIEIVVAFLVVNFFVFLVITRNPGDGEVPG